MADNALYGLPQQYRGQNALMSGQQEPVMRSYQEPWYRALPNRLTDYIYGPDATAQQAAGVRHLVGPENPLNLPGQFSEGIDTARTGYQLGNNLMTGLGAFQAMTALPIPGAKVAGQVAKQEAKGIRAYHGSPHDFDKFDASKIGTGEGAQAYGHGLYFAEREGVAKSYRDKLAPSDALYDGKSKFEFGMGADGGYHEKISAADLLQHFNGDRDAAIAHQTKLLGNYRSKMDISKGQDVLNVLRSKTEATITEPGGRMYEVRINADPEHFLDWDKPLSQQSEKVRSAILGTVPGDKRPYFEKWAADPDVTARDLYEQIGGVISPGAGKNHASPMVAAALRDAGVPGTKYLDQGSRAAGEGSRNYVVFDPATIEILRKYGLLGLMSGSVAAGAMPQQPNALYGGQ